MTIDQEVITRYSEAHKAHGITGMYNEALEDNTKLYNIRKLIEEYRSESTKDRNIPSTHMTFLIVASEIEQAIGGK